MFSRHFIAAAIGLGCMAPLLAGAEPPDHRPGGVNAREHRQAMRIKDGVKDGDLARGDLDRLKADEAAIRAEERVYRKSGGSLTKWERRDLERDLDKTSRTMAGRAGYAG